MNDASLLTGAAYWLPVIFIGLMVLAFFIYAILDGYDLGVEFCCQTITKPSAIL